MRRYRHQVKTVLRRATSRWRSGWVGLLCLLAASSVSPVVAVEMSPLRIATFGTSLTSRGGWQEPLAKAIEACTGRAVEIDDFAKAGEGSDWGMMAVGRVAKSRSDIVLIEFAVNDAAVNKLLSVSSSVRNMRGIVDSIRAERPDAIIYFMRMSPVLGRRAWARPWRESYETAHRSLAQELGIGLIDHSPGWDALGEDAVAAAIPDGAHPDPVVAARIVVPTILARLKADGRVTCAAPPEKAPS